LRFRNFTSDIHGDTPGAFNPRGTDERELTVPELFQHPEGFPERAIDPPEIAAELHVRLVRIASTLVLPLVAAPLAIVRQRARRSYGFVLGIGLLLLFNQLIQLGKTLADNDKLSVGLALWMPLALFTALGLWLSIRKWRRVPTGGGPTLIERAIERLAGRLRRRLPLTRKTAS
jgi:lipopolysaccharide export system permease protein